jgi:hypothetical protein
VAPLNDDVRQSPQRSGRHAADRHGRCC